MGIFDNFIYKDGKIVDNNWVKWFHWGVPDEEGKEREEARQRKDKVSFLVSPRNKVTSDIKILSAFLMKHLFSLKKILTLPSFSKTEHSALISRQLKFSFLQDMPLKLM